MYQEERPTPLRSPLTQERLDGAYDAPLKRADLRFSTARMRFTSWKIVDPAVVYKSLSTVIRSYHASYVRILGSEPLLHPGIVELIAAARASRVADNVLVCTNSILLASMPSEIWLAVETVVISMYLERRLPLEEVRRLSRIAPAQRRIRRQLF